MKMKPSRNLVKSFCIILFVLFHFSCNSDLIILFDERNGSSGSGSGPGIPVEMSWITDQQNVTTGGWNITNDGRRIRFDIEDSENCGGTNDKPQSGSATVTITTSETYKFIPDIKGIAEMQNISFESMDVSINNIMIVQSKSVGGGLGCKMGPVQLMELVPPPYILQPGVNTFKLAFTTGDGLFHKDAFYELNLVFEKP